MNETLSIDQLRLMLDIAKVIVIPSVLWIIRHPLLELFRLVLRFVGLGMVLEALEDSKVHGTFRVDYEIKENAYKSYVCLVYRTIKGYYTYVIINYKGKIINRSRKAFLTLGHLHEHIKSSKNYHSIHSKSNALKEDRVSLDYIT